MVKDIDSNEVFSMGMKRKENPTNYKLNIIKKTKAMAPGK